ncbi:hypothetical protein V1505DRAFT_374065 [Lipomyces doorenjongii]
MAKKSDKGQLILALLAMEQNPKLSNREADRIYSASHGTLGREDVVNLRDALWPTRDSLPTWNNR